MRGRGARLRAALRTFREIVLPSALPDPPGSVPPRRTQWLRPSQHWEALSGGVRDYVASFSLSFPPPPKAEQHAPGDDDDAGPAGLKGDLRAPLLQPEAPSAVLSLTPAQATLHVPAPVPPARCCGSCTPVGWQRIETACER